MAQQYARQPRREERAHVGIRKDEDGFKLVACNAQAAGLDHHGYAAFVSASGQMVARLQSLFELVGAYGDELQHAGRRVARDMRRAAFHEGLGGPRVETMRAVALGHDDAGHLGAARVDGPQRRRGAIAIHGEEHAGGIGHLAQQGFAYSGILVRLLVLGVLPGMGCHHQGDR
ncbi:hypothetical protein D9M68_596970 [compost metagenome]